jgi:hypothetical protein
MLGGGEQGRGPRAEERLDLACKVVWGELVAGLNTEWVSANSRPGDGDRLPPGLPGIIV